MAKEREKLFLLDAMALIYRAHFAFLKNPRVNSKGQSTGATFGFVNTVMEILTKEKPTHIGVAFDTHAPTFRHIEYEAYKANRQEQPEDIRLAEPYVKRFLAAMGIPAIELDGFEADDVIGTLAKRASEAGYEVYMMTPDKDYGQLVEEHVFLYKPSYQGKGIEIMGIPEICARWDIEHVGQVCDVLGLMGDAVDNVPGVPGVGEKTAIKLIKEYGTVENLLDHAHEIKGKLGENLVNYKAQALLSKKLVCIDTNVPVPFDPNDLVLSPPDKDKIREVFEELEFRTLTARVLGEEPAKTSATKTAKKKDGSQLSLFGEEASLAAETANEQGKEEAGQDEPTEKRTIANTEHRYYAMDSQDLQEELVELLLAQEEFCFDTETDSLDMLGAELVGLSFSYATGEGYFVPLPAKRKEAQVVLERFRPVFEKVGILKIAQNLKFDMGMLKNYGIEMCGPYFDTMLAHYLLEPDQRHGMNYLAEAYLNYTPVAIETLIGKKGKDQGTMRDVELGALTEYAAEDADITLQLKPILYEALKKNDLLKLHDDLEAPLVPVLNDMEREGIAIDTAALAELSITMGQEVLEIEQKIYTEAGEKFNIGSPLQLGNILFEKLKLDAKPKKTPTGQYATGEEILSRLAVEHEIARLITDYRQVQKLKSTYIDSLPLLISKTDGRVHSSFNQAVAATGRLSSTNPNLQNIPIRTERGREIRKAFVPRDSDHVIVSADYSQIELRIMASFSGDETMIEAFKQGKDIHAITASRVFKVELADVTSDMRRKAKTANFGIIYGISAFGLSQRLSIPRGEASDIIKAYFSEFPKVKEYMDNVIAQAKEREYVETALGRRRYLRDINSRNATQQGFAERNAINAPIQGSAADMIKLAMIAIDKWLKESGLKSKMVLQVHDELVFDALKTEVETIKPHIIRLMADALPLAVPVEVGFGVGENWLEAH